MKMHEDFTPTYMQDFQNVPCTYMYFILIAWRKLHQYCPVKFMKFDSQNILSKHLHMASYQMPEIKYWN